MSILGWASVAFFALIVIACAVFAVILTLNSDHHDQDNGIDYDKNWSEW